MYVVVPDPDTKVGPGTLYVYHSEVCRKVSVRLENANLFPRRLYYFMYTKFQRVGDIHGINIDLVMNIMQATSGWLKISPFPHGRSMIHGCLVRGRHLQGFLWVGIMVSQKCCFSNKIVKYIWIY